MPSHQLYMIYVDKSSHTIEKYHGHRVNLHHSRLEIMPKEVI